MLEITVKKELGYYDLKDACCCYDSIFDNIENANKESDFMELLAEYQEMIEGNGGELPTMTELNDYIRFQTDEIYEYLGLTEDGEIPTDEEE